MSEKELLELLQNPTQKERAFSLLLDEYQERLYWHIRQMVLSHDDADDVLQNTFIKIYQKISDFRGDSALYSWMYRIATNQALDFLRKKSRQQHISVDEYIVQKSTDLQSDAYFEGNAMELKLQQAIAQLPEKQRLVFQMKYFQEMTYEEMSSILDTSVGALKASYHHAVKKIRSFIEND